MYNVEYYGTIYFLSIKEQSLHILNVNHSPQNGQLVFNLIRNLSVQIDLSRVAKLDANQVATDDNLELPDTKSLV